MMPLSAHDYVSDSKTMEILSIYYVLGAVLGLRGLGQR